MLKEWESKFINLNELFIDSINYVDVLNRNKERAGFMPSLSFESNQVKIYSVPNQYIRKKYKLITASVNESYYDNIKLIRKFEKLLDSMPFQIYEFNKKSNVMLINSSICICAPDKGILSYNETYSLHSIIGNDMTTLETNDQNFFEVLNNTITENFVYPVYGGLCTKTFNDLDQDELNTIKMYMF